MRDVSPVNQLLQRIARYKLESRVVVDVIALSKVQRQTILSGYVTIACRVHRMLRVFEICSR